MRTALLPLLWRELESLFFAPLAYIVLTVMLVLNGISFFMSLTLANGVVEDTVISFLGGAGNVLFWIILVMLPALVTMRLVSEERRTGTLEVLLTAPVRDGEVILAKYLGAMIFQAFLWGPTLLHIVLLRRYGALPDPGQLISCYVGIACVTALLTAVGLLCSTRTANQLVAAVSALAANMMLLIVPEMLPALQWPALTELARAVSMTEHFATSFSRGILDSGALVFYIATSLALLVVATRSLEARRWR